MGTIIGMYSNTTLSSTAASIAQIDVPKAGMLVGLSFACRADIDADTEFGDYEVSFGSTPGFTANDSRSVITRFTCGQCVLGAAGVATVLANGYVPLPAIPVGAGERIFLHGFAAATLAQVCYVGLHFDFDLDQIPTRRR